MHHFRPGGPPPDVIRIRMLLAQADDTNKPGAVGVPLPPSWPAIAECAAPGSAVSLRSAPNSTARVGIPRATEGNPAMPEDTFNRRAHRSGFLILLLAIAIVFVGVR
jgi:hypothetical protein